MNPALGEAMLRLLVSRDGQDTAVRLTNGNTVLAKNVAWGRDQGEAYDHVTTNVSPPGREPVDHFLTSEVVAIMDPVSGQRLLSDG